MINAENWTSQFTSYGVEKFIMGREAVIDDSEGVRKKFKTP